MPGRAMTDGLAAIGDCVVQLKSGKGLVTSSGSTPSLVGRISADLNTLRKVIPNLWTTRASSPRY